MATTRRSRDGRDVVVTALPINGRTLPPATAIDVV